MRVNKNKNYKSLNKTRWRGHSKYVRSLFDSYYFFLRWGGSAPPHTPPLGLCPRPRVSIPHLSHISFVCTSVGSDKKMNTHFKNKMNTHLEKNNCSNA